MNRATVGKKHLQGELDTELSNLTHPGEIEIFLAEGVQHLKRIRTADTTSARADIHPETKKFWTGVSNT